MGSRLEAEVESLNDALRRRVPSIPALPVGWRGAGTEYEGAQDRSDLLALDRATLRPELFDYQRELVERILSLPHGSEGLLALPTGAGKTRTALAAVLQATGTGAANSTVWLAPTLELLDQAFDTAAELWTSQGNVPRLNLTRGPAGQDSVPFIFFTTPQAIYSRVQRRTSLPVFELIVFDEAHQLGATTFRSATTALREVSPAARLVGLSATPGRILERETEDLVELFGRRLLTSDILRPDPILVLQRRGVLAKLEFRSLTKRHIAQGDEVERLRIGLNACRRLVSERKRILVFTGSVAGAVVLSEALRSVGIPAAAVYSELSQAERRDRIGLFATGNLSVLTNQRLLATGYDCPAVTDVVLLAPVASAILFEQMVGRGARGPVTGGTRRGTIWEFDNHLSMHGLPQSYYRYRDFAWN